MKKRTIARSAAMLIVLGTGTAHAGDAVLYTPVLSSPVGGSLECHVTNVGKKDISEVLRESRYGSGVPTSAGSPGRGQFRG